MRPQRIIWLAALFTLVPLALHASDTPPRLMFIELAQSDGRQRAESDFVTTLQLNLDRYTVEKTPVALPDFEAVAAQFKLETLYPLLKETDVHGAMWLSVGTGNVMTLHVATLEQERAAIRLIRSRSGGNSPRELARTAAAMFETDSLLALDAEPEPSVPATATPPKAADDLATADATRVTPRWYMGARLGGAITGHTGPAWRLGGRTGLQLDLNSHVSIKVGAGGGYGPFGKTDRFTLSGGSVLAELALQVGFSKGPVTAGPVVGISGGQQFTRVEEAGVSTVYRYPLVEAEFGVHGSIPVGKARTGLSLGIFMCPYRTVITARSDGENLYRNQTLGWFVTNEWTFF